MTSHSPDIPDATKRYGIARVLSKLGYCSRSAAEELVKAGRVALNGAVTRDPETPVRMGIDDISVDGNDIKAVGKVYWMLNKPRGLVTTADDEKGRETVYALLPKGLPWMGPVGRLDMESEGLLLMTNDTAWANRITAPETHLEKTYHVQLDRAADLKSFETGIEEGGDFLKAKRANPLKNGWIEIVLDEGKNRQIRRMVETTGAEVLRLVRVKIGNLELGELPKGAARELTPEDIKLLL